MDIASGKRQIRAVPGDGELLEQLRLAPASPVLLLEGTSYDQDERPVEVFSTWHHPDHVVFDIDIVKNSSAAPRTNRQENDGGPGGPVPSIALTPPGDSPNSAASRARRLGAELLRLADDLSSTNGR